jgi:hypothetical protein
MLISRSRIAFTFIAFALVACSSAPPDSPLQGEVSPSASSKKKNSKTTTNDDSENDNLNSGTTQNTDPTDPSAPAPATPATPTAPAPTNGQCAAQQTFDTCMQCCDTAFPGGFEVDAQAFGQCACVSPGVCAQACAGSFCAGGQATAACEQCLVTATQCETVAEQTCNANASCSGVFTCLDSSGCEAKP